MANPVDSGYDTTEPLELDIDLENIVGSFNSIEDVENAIEMGVSLGLDELCERLAEKVLENLNKYGLGASPIARDIRVYRTGNGLAIEVGTDYAVYVEFGTGIVGEQNPHPHAWQYDVNGHGEKGWWYPTTSDDPNPTKRINKQDGSVWAWTKGQASRPFMYDSWLWASRSATQIIRKHIRREIKKVKGVR